MKIMNVRQTIVIYEDDSNSLLETIRNATEKGMCLSGADLHGVDLRNADLRGLVLRNANLSKADFYNANLTGAELFQSDLSGCELSTARLVSANLQEANLSKALLCAAELFETNLNRADLSEADLRGADLREANLFGAKLFKTELTGVNLAGAYLHRAIFDDVRHLDLIFAKLNIIPEGDIIGWKKARSKLNGIDIVVKLLIPKGVRRTNATGRKCRSESAIDIGHFTIHGVKLDDEHTAISNHDAEFEYHVGRTVKCDNWDENRWEECSGGIHWFISRVEAENY
jgi:hypothetical protein